MKNDGYHDQPYDYDEDGDNREIMTIAIFMDAVRHRAYVDDDGHGALMANEEYIPGPNQESRWYISPSEAHTIPAHATHIDWYNK